MEIEIVNKKEEDKVKFEDLKEGTVIEILGSNLLVVKDKNKVKSVMFLDKDLDLSRSAMIRRAERGDFKVIGKAKKLIVEAI